MRRFIVRKRAGIGMYLVTHNPQFEKTTWWDVIDSGNENVVMTTKRTEKLAYDAARELEKSHMVRNEARRRR